MWTFPTSRVIQAPIHACLARTPLPIARPVRPVAIATKGYRLVVSVESLISSLLCLCALASRIAHLK